MHNHCVSTSMQFFDMKSVLRVRQCFANKNKNCASHDCSASHHCRLVSSLFEIRHAKTSLVQTCHKTKIKVLCTSPLLNWRRSETCTKKQISSTCHANFLGKIMQHAGQKQKQLFGFGCSMQHAKNHEHAQGVLSSGTNCGQNGLCKFFVIHTGCCPVDIIYPCMFLTLAPTKTLCEQIAKTS